MADLNVMGSNNIINKITGVTVGQYGEVIILTVVDKNGTAVDVSAYTTSLNVTIRDPYTLNVKSYSASFVATGSNGQIQFTPAAGDIDRAGTWEGQIKLEKASALAMTKVFDIVIERKLSAST